MPRLGHQPAAPPAGRGRSRWLAALALAIFAGGPLVAMAFPAVLRIPKVKDHPPGAPQAAALFSHRTHGTFACYACHPTIFPQAPVGFTHEDMRRGERCGRCHDGARGTAVNAMRCESCHAR
jgi:c(7)-type cytochrome triheme protein